MDNAFIEWWEKNEKRESHEWDKWNGSIADGIRIVDAQCERINSANEKFNTNYLKAFDLK